LNNGQYGIIHLKHRRRLRAGGNRNQKKLKEAAMWPRGLRAWRGIGTGVCLVTAAVLCGLAAQTFHPVEQTEDPASYAGEGLSWRDAGVSIQALQGYVLEHIWAGAFSLAGQIEQADDGSLYIGDPERERIVRIRNGIAETITANALPRWLTLLPDGRIAYYKHSRLTAVDPDTGETEELLRLPGGVDSAGSLSVDSLGRIHGIVGGPHLIRLNADGGYEALATNLPYTDHWRITDLAIAEDGTAYVAGFDKVIAVSPNGSIETIATGLNHEPVFVDIAPDGRVYINELAKGLQRYTPSTGSLEQVDCQYGFADFVAQSNDRFTFFDASGAYYELSLRANSRTALARADTGNSHAFAAVAGGVFFATVGVPPWGAHMVEAKLDGSYSELSQQTHEYIVSADVDSEGRLSYIADGTLYRIEPSGTVTMHSIHLPSGTGEWYTASLACRPTGGWILATRTSEAASVVAISETGQTQKLPFTLDRTLFGRSFAKMDDARVDVGPDGRLTIIATGIVQEGQGPYLQRVYQADANGSHLTEIANLDSQRIAGMVDVAVGPDGSVYALVVTGSTGSPDSIFRIEPGQSPVEAIRIQAGRDPRSIDVGPDGVIWFGTTLGVFCAIPDGV